MKRFHLFGIVVCLLLCLQLKAQNSNVYLIQVATYADPQYKDFNNIHNLGYLYAEMQSNKLYKVMMGTFEQYNAAKRTLGKLQAKGYKDAFIKKVPVRSKDAVYIVQMATFSQKDKIYWGDWERLTTDLCIQLSDNKLRIASGPYYNKEEAEKAMTLINQKGGRSDVFVKRVSEKVLHPLSLLEKQRYNTNTIAAKRASVQELQSVLSQSGYYKDQVDGKWGKNTAAALAAFQTNDEHYNKYLLLGEKQEFKTEIEEYTLQYYINLIDKDAFAAEQGLKRFKHPLAKVYLAYMYLNGELNVENAEQTINALMHQVIDQVFKNYRLKTRYDFTQKYAYTDMPQFIHHLRAIHEAVKDEPDVPCWLFRRHPALAADAFAPYFNNERDAYQISSDCGSFLDLPQLQILMTIATDLASGKANDLVKMNQLYAHPMLLSHDEIKNLEKWNAKVWSHLYEWSKASPLQSNTYNVLKLSYYDVLRVLENHYAQKGFAAYDARALGLSTLKHAVGCSLDAYCKE